MIKLDCSKSDISSITYRIRCSWAWPGGHTYIGFVPSVQLNQIAEITIFMTQISIFITGYAVYNFIHDAYTAVLHNTVVQILCKHVPRPPVKTGAGLRPARYDSRYSAYLHWCSPWVHPDSNHQTRDN